MHGVYYVLVDSWLFDIHFSLQQSDDSFTVILYGWCTLHTYRYKLGKCFHSLKELPTTPFFPVIFDFLCFKGSAVGT